MFCSCFAFRGTSKRAESREREMRALYYEHCAIDVVDDDNDDGLAAHDQTREKVTAAVDPSAV